MSNTKIKSKVVGLLFSTFAMMSFTQCCSTKKLQPEAPTTFGEVYYKDWVAGIEGGGSGTNIFIEVPTKDIVLDSVYFKGRTAKLETKPNAPSLYIGRFLSDVNTGKMNQIADEADTSVADVDNKDDFPFELMDNECVVSYKTEKGKIKYYKLTDIVQKPADEYPSAKKPDNNQQVKQVD